MIATHMIDKVNKPSMTIYLLTQSDCLISCQMAELKTIKFLFSPKSVIPYLMVEDGIDAKLKNSLCIY